jgi:hypothetical protein
VGAPDTPGVMAPTVGKGRERGGEEQKHWIVDIHLDLLAP